MYRDLDFDLPEVTSDDELSASYGQAVDLDCPFADSVYHHRAEIATNVAPNSRLTTHEHVPLEDLASKHYCATHAWRRALRATHTHTRFTSLRALAVDNTSTSLQMARNAAPMSRLATHGQPLQRYILRDPSTMHIHRPRKFQALYVMTHTFRGPLST